MEENRLSRIVPGFSPLSEQEMKNIEFKTLPMVKVYSSGVVIRERDGIPV